MNEQPTKKKTDWLELAIVAPICLIAGAYLRDSGLNFWLSFSAVFTLWLASLSAYRWLKRKLAK